VPGVALHVQALAPRSPLQADPGATLLVLEGRLVVDLPQGDYRVLERGDLFRLPEGPPARLQALASQALVAWLEAG